MKRRACSLRMATLLMILVYLSVWQMISSPGRPDITPVLSQQLKPPAYSLLTAANASSDPPYELERLPLDDYLRLMDLPDFHFTMLAGACNDSRTPLLLVLVHSAPANADLRATIRATWGSPRDSVHLVFLVGTVHSPQLHQQLLDEQQLHADLVQGSFDDAYRNMTYKHVMALKFAAYHCPRARYVLKTDDDVFVNIPTMMTFLSVELSVWGARRLLYCNLNWSVHAIRSPSKWRVSFKEYPHPTYPTYCSGYVILYSPDVVFTLYREAQKANYFWIDDVLVTGMMAENARLKHTQVGHAFLLQHAVLSRLLQSNSSAPLADHAFLFGPPNLSSAKIRALWRRVDSYHQHHRTTTAVAAAALASSAGQVDERSD